MLGQGTALPDYHATGTSNCEQKVYMLPLITPLGRGLTL
jgi:hypothetical protein